MKLYFADFNFSKSKLHYKDDIRDKLINEYLWWYLLVRFLALVTTMVTMVDHGNHRSNDRSNHHGYYDRYYNVNA